MKIRLHTIIGSFLFLFSLIFFLMNAGCSSSSNGTTPTTTTSTVPLGTSIKNVQLVAGVESNIKFTFTIPSGSGSTSKGDFTINMAETLKNITLSASPITKNTNRFETLRLLAHALIKDAFAATSPASVIGFISYAGDPDVCTNGFQIGPYSISGEIGAALSSDTKSIELTAPQIDIVSAGTFEVCVVTTPPISAYLSVSGIAVDHEPCSAATVNIVGNWTGTYQCTNFGEPSEPLQQINLTISRNADGSYHYEDDLATYDGHLCGNIFKFNGGYEFAYTESGQFTFSSDTAATKTSVWYSTPPGSGGECSDTLQKI